MDESSIKADKWSEGFTLIELMITLAVAAILLLIAVPSFSLFIRNQQVITQANEFVTSLNLARSEAIKRRAVVRVTANSSAGSSNEWGGGWSTSYVDSSTQILRISPELDRNNTLNSAGDYTSFSYSPDGSINQADTIDLCTTVSGDVGRRVSVARTGKVKMEKINCP